MAIYHGYTHKIPWRGGISSKKSFHVELTARFVSIAGAGCSIGGVPSTMVEIEQGICIHKFATNRCNETGVSKSLMSCRPWLISVGDLDNSFPNTTSAAVSSLAGIPDCIDVPEVDS